MSVSAPDGGCEAAQKPPPASAEVARTEPAPPVPATTTAPTPAAVAVDFTLPAVVRPPRAPPSDEDREGDHRTAEEEHSSRNSLFEGRLPTTASNSSKLAESLASGLHFMALSSRSDDSNASASNGAALQQPPPPTNTPVTTTFGMPSLQMQVPSTPPRSANGQQPLGSNNHFGGNGFQMFGGIGGPLVAGSHSQSPPEATARDPLQHVPPLFSPNSHHGLSSVGSGLGFGGSNNGGAVGLGAGGTASSSAHSSPLLQPCAPPNDSCLSQEAIHLPENLLEDDDVDFFSQSGGLEMDVGNSMNANGTPPHPGSARPDLQERYLQVPTPRTPQRNNGPVNLHHHAPSTSNSTGMVAYSNGLMSNNGGGVSHMRVEHPSRTLYVGNIDDSLSDQELLRAFAQFGDVRDLYVACRHKAFVRVSYYDIRSARNALVGLQSHPLEVYYTVPQKTPNEKTINQGTLVVFNLDASVTNEQLYRIFSEHGEVKEIRETPNKRHHKFVEFYDVRAAEAALQALNRAEIAGKKIKLEPSRPGGARRTMMTKVTNELMREEARHREELLLQGGSSSVPIHHGALARNLAVQGHGNGSPPYHHHHAPHYQHARGVSSPGPVGPRGMPAYASCLNEGSIGMRATAVNIGKATGNGSGPSGHSESLTGVTSAGAGGALQSNLLASSPVFQPRSYNGLRSGIGPVGPGFMGRDGGLGGAEAGSFTGSGSFQGGFMTSHQQRPASRQQPQQSMSPGSLWGAYGAAGSDAHLVSRTKFNLMPQQPNGSGFLGGSSAVRAASEPWAGLQNGNSNGSITSNGNGGSGLISRLRAPIPHGGPSSSGLQGFDLAGSPGSSFSASPPSMPGAHLSRSYSNSTYDTQHGGTNCLAHRWAQVPEAFPKSHSQGHDLSEHVPSENGWKSLGQFNLDPKIVREGKDLRTTLMLRNIPNKYSQSMLLEKIDETHKECYDFFYLPIDFKNKCNMGYAFINMLDTHHVLSFYSHFNGKGWEKFNSEKVATVSYGRIQGRDALKDHFQNSSLMHEEKRCRPIIFHYPSSRASGSGSTSRSVQLTSNNPEQREAGEAEAFPSTPKSSKYHSQRGN
mmetsp:Transcript_8652/g.31899  ORF Transcript_8652/g.31899 Transcript_8652/m.31899 type:complete len:1084 (-) Transcript_8652:411-3662(-)